MSEQKETLISKTTIIMGKDTSQMTLNDIFQASVHVIETKANNNK